MSDAANAPADLLRWIEIESPTHAPAGVNAMMDLVAAEARAADIAWERVPGRDGLGDQLILRAGPALDRPGLLILSHLDTVHPLGTLAHLPVRVEGDRLYGPGVFDMKGGAWLALQAFKAVAGEGSAKLPLTFVFTADEEIGSPTSRGMIEDLGRRSCGVLVTEPARDGGGVVTARKGVGRFDVQVEGRPSHAGTKHAEGRNAIAEAARLILAIQGLTDYARGVTTTVGLIEGGTAENVVPQHCRFAVDLRVTNAADGAHFERHIHALAPQQDFRLTITGGMNRPPYEKTEDVARLYERARGIGAGIGLALHDVPMTGGGSDGNFTAALGIPTLDGLGIAGDGAHTLSEYALLSSIAPRTLLMRRLLEMAA